MIFMLFSLVRDRENGEMVKEMGQVERERGGYRGEQDSRMIGNPHSAV